MNSNKIIFATIGVILVIASIAMLGYLKTLNRILLYDTLLLKSSPAGVLIIFAILILGGVYLFNIAGKIIKGAIKAN